MRTFTTTTASPLGPIQLAGSEQHLTGVWFAQRRHAPDTTGWESTRTPFERALLQLEAYFAGELREFVLDLAQEGTPFQRQVWEELATVPYGSTISYAELAARIGRPGAARAVGAANGRNQLSIIIPCHRVIGHDGRLVDYGGGLARKQALLELEGAR